MRYQINDTILYAAQGVCTIAAIVERGISGKKLEYYVLKPVYDDRSTIYVPVDSEALIARMRRVMSPDEIYTLIRSMPDESTLWVENDYQRRDQYKTVLADGERSQLVCMIKTLYQRQLEQRGKGKKLHLADERFLRDAEKLLYEEFAHVLSIRREQVLPLIMEQIEVARKIS